MTDLDDILREEYNKLNGLNSYGMPIKPRHIFLTDPSIELNKPVDRTYTEAEIREAFIFSMFLSDTIRTKLTIELLLDRLNNPRP